MQEYILIQGLYICRIFIAGICGILIGWERQNRMKVAGTKTHFIIAVTAAMMMIVSKYGFYDALSGTGTSVDVSRVASGILAGLGIMGGGLVITGKQGVTSGITTAAGIWATVGIGMAFGAGMYVIGISVTILLLLGQFLMHKYKRFARHSWRGQIEIRLNKNQQEVEKITSRLEQEGIDILHIKCESREQDNDKLKIIFAVSARKEREDIVGIIEGIPNLCSYEI